MKSVITLCLTLITSLFVATTAHAQNAAAEAPSVSSVNTFNRLMQPQQQINPSPLEDGIHDAANPGTGLLQAPKAAFDSLDKSKHGNHVDWVSSLQNSKINPRWDRIDDTMQPIVFDLNIVREVKGSMPNVVYPHKQHTEWLDCSNCHPDIFIPQKGANQINMASILLGEKCGVCHGKVAFPVTTSTCTLCHSQKKENTELKRSTTSAQQ